MKRLILSLGMLMLLAVVSYASDMPEYGILRPGGLHSALGEELVSSTTSVTDTLTWRSKAEPDVNFGFLNPGDSLLVWFDPPAPCQLIAIRCRNMNFEGHPLFDIWDASQYDPKTYSIDSVDANGWWGTFDPITCPTCWVPGQSDHSPLRWNADDPEHHFWGPFPYTFTSHHANLWIEIPAEAGLQGQVLLSGDPIYLSSPFYITAGWGFAAEYPWARPFPCFKFYSAGTGPDGVHDGWYLRSYFLWFELIVKYFENTPPKITQLTQYPDTYDAGPFPVTVAIDDRDADVDSLAGVASAEFIYMLNGTLHRTPMTGLTVDNIYSAQIPELAVDDDITYWVEAVDLAGDSSRSGKVMFSRVAPEHPESNILVIWDMWSDSPLDSFYIDLFNAIEETSDQRFTFELWNVHDHLGIDSSILNWGWNTIFVCGMESRNTLPGRDYDGDMFVDWLESGTSQESHNLLYIDQDYFRAHSEYGYDWDGELGAGDFLHDYFGVVYAISDKRGVTGGGYDKVAFGVADFSDIRVNFDPDQLPYPYHGSEVRPDWIDEITHDTELFMRYSNHPQYAAAVRLDRGHYKTVYLPWQDFFAVDKDEHGDLVPRPDLTVTITKILSWFGFNTEVSSSGHAQNIPQKFVLNQNYPNPFNVTTDIRYEIVDGGSPSSTSLKIYNILGQEVRTLVDDTQEAGMYTIRWNGTDAFGNDVGSGIYCYQLKVGDFVETKQMLLLK